MHDLERQSIIKSAELAELLHGELNSAMSKLQAEELGVPPHGALDERLDAISNELNTKFGPKIDHCSDSRICLLWEPERFVGSVYRDLEFRLQACTAQLGAKQGGGEMVGALVQQRALDAAMRAMADRLEVWRRQHVAVFQMDASLEVESRRLAAMLREEIEAALDEAAAGHMVS